MSGEIGLREIELDVTAHPGGRWRLNGEDRSAVDGCIDIDLGFSPSTNLLPIRRLSLAVGQSAGVQAAWLPFPSLTFEALPQTYRRLGDMTYRYESRNGAFIRELDVNEDGFVTRYPGLWEAESAE